MEHAHPPQTAPGQRTFTNLPQIPNEHMRDSPFNRGRMAPKWQMFNETVAAGQESSQHADFPVECWMFAVIASASVRISASPGPSAAGPVLLFGGGGHANIPGDGGGDISYRNTGAVPATIVAIATVGYRWELDYDPGDLA